LRRERPDITGGFQNTRVEFDAAAGWLVMARGHTWVACNLAPHPQSVPLAGCQLTVLLASAPNIRLTPDAVELPAESVAIVASSPPSPAHAGL